MIPTRQKQPDLQTVLRHTDESRTKEHDQQHLSRQRDEQSSLLKFINPKAREDFDQTKRP